MDNYKIKHKKVEAAILTEQKNPLLIDTIELPQKLEYGQVLVKLLYTSICGSQLGEIAGVKGEDPYLPHLLGHEGSGVVLQIGPGVSRVKTGDSVVLHWKKASGIEAPTPKYQWKKKKLNAGAVTTFNEQAIISENRLTVIPKTFDMELAALLGCAVTTGLGVVNNDAQIRIGESLVVFGAGGVGLSIIQGAKMVSADPIIAVDLTEEKIELAKSFGATHGIIANEKQLSQEILNITGGKGTDVIVDNTGNIKLIELAYQLTKPQGRTILVGVPNKENQVSLYSLPLHFGKQLKGSHGGKTIPDEDIPRYIHLHEKGKLELKKMITNRYPFSQINQAIEAMKEGKVAGRCMLDFSKTS